MACFSLNRWSEQFDVLHNMDRYHMLVFDLPIIRIHQQYIGEGFEFMLHDPLLPKIDHTFQYSTDRDYNREHRCRGSDGVFNCCLYMPKIIKIFCNAFKAPTDSNTRYDCLNVMQHAKQFGPLFGIEQKYNMLDLDGQPLEWPVGGTACEEAAVEKLRLNHDNDVLDYSPGPWNIGKYDRFSGVADRGAYIRIPRQCAADGFGYLEDRRPTCDSDPYCVTRRIVQTICLD